MCELQRFYFVNPSPKKLLPVKSFEKTGFSISLFDEKKSNLLLFKGKLSNQSAAILEFLKINMTLISPCDNTIFL